MKLYSDFHSHVSSSSAAAMAQSAQERGLRVLGLSEHVFQMNETRAYLKHMKLEGPTLTFSSYIDAVYAAAHDLHFDVRLGLEVDFIPEKNQLIQAALKRYAWDFLIGSVHQIDENQFEHAGKLEREEGEALWLRYFQV